MPIINNLERQQILKQAIFLQDKGYDLIEQDEYGFLFSNGNIQFSIFYERWQEASDVSLKFLSENTVFSIGWISIVVDGDKSNKIHQKLENVLYLLEFISINYKNLIDIDFCKIKMQEAEALFHKKHSK